MERPLIFGSLLGILLLLLGCGESAPQIFRYQLISAPGTLDPAGNFGAQDMGVIDRLFDGLTRLDRTRGIAVPEIARHWAISPDGLTYEFFLRDDVVFHNGRALTAEDVEYSWRRLLDPKSGSPYRWMIESIEAFEVLSPRLLRVRLRVPEPTFLLRLANPATSIVPREEVERLGTRFSRSPVGSGPYRLREWVGDLRVELEAFVGHYEHRTQIQTLLYEVIPNEEEALQRFERGELDLVVRLPKRGFESLTQELSETAHEFPGLAWAGVCFRCDRPPFDDVRVRRAVSLAIDRDDFVETIGPSQYSASSSFLPPSVLLRPAEEEIAPAPLLDLETARRLMTEAGYPDGRGIAPLKFATATSQRDALVGRFLLDALERLGIDGDMHTHDAASLSSHLAEDGFSVFRGGWIADFPDPEPFLRSQFHSRAGYNEFAYQNPEVDRLLDLSRTLPEKERLRTLREVERIIVADAPCIVFVQKTEVVLLRRGWTGIPFGFVSEALEAERALWESAL